MSAPPIGMIRVTPIEQAEREDRPRRPRWPSRPQITSTTTRAQRWPGRWRCSAGGGPAAGSARRPCCRSAWRRRSTEPVKVMAPMARPSDSSIRLLRWTCPVLADDAVGRRGVDRRHGHQTGGQADQAVEGGHQLRHRGHRRPCGRSPPPPRRRRPRRRAIRPMVTGSSAPWLHRVARVVGTAMAMPTMP